MKAPRLRHHAPHALQQVVRGLPLHPQLAAHRPRRHPALVVGDQVDGHEPLLQRDMRAVHRRALRHHLQAGALPALDLATAEQQRWGVRAALGARPAVRRPDSVEFFLAFVLVLLGAHQPDDAADLLVRHGLAFLSVAVPWYVTHPVLGVPRNSLSWAYG